MMMMNLGCRG